MATPAYSTYTNHELESIFDVKFQSYIDSYLALQKVAENPAQDAEDYYLANIPESLTIEEAKTIADNSRSIDKIVSVQTESQQAIFNDALDFCTEYFSRFNRVSGFDQMVFRNEGYTMDYDSSLNTITVNVIP